MATRIKHKRSSISGNKPSVTQLESGELAINTADGKVFLLRDDNTVQDITQRIFENDSEIVVNDTGDSSGTISVTVNGDQKLTITNSEFNFEQNVDINNGNKITFRELSASGDDGISLKAPNNLAGGYDLVLPTIPGTVGQILAVDGNGQLYFNDADIFGGNVIYVSAEQGNDANDGQSAPVRTVKRACQIASGLVYNPDGSINFRRVNIKVAVGDYTEQNPIIVPDNTVIKGDGLRGCIIRPANANQDMLRVRNACYFGEFTFRDGVDGNFVPTITWDYAVSFDDPSDTTVSRVGYTNLPDSRPTITTSPYVQNTSIISFLGGNGAKIDGTKVATPNVPLYSIEAENPVVGAIPEQGKSMVANAFTHISFGGTGWRLTNDAYAQIVSCFQIFLLNGVYCQSGGYCSITNSATNFGLYALRSSGYSPKAFVFDRGYVVETGQSEGQQTLKIIGIGRDTPVEEFIVRFREPDYKIAYDLIQMEKAAIAQDTVDWINAQIAGASPSIWAGFSYNEAKCARDVRLLLDAIRFDIMFNSNYRSIGAAKAYYRANASLVISGQLDQTVAALGQAKTYTAEILSDSTAISRSNALWDEIIDIVQNGTAAADPYTIPNPTGYDTGFANARTLLLNNRNFIVEEITQWIAEQVATETDPFTLTFSYDVAKCERDVNLIIDALRYDITYGGNLETLVAALAYYVGSTSQLGTGEKEATVAAFVRLRNIVEDIVQAILITKTSTNTLTQDASTTAGSVDAANFLVARIQEIIDYIDTDGAVAPSRIDPDTSWVSATLQEEGLGALNEEGRINTAQRVTQYINEQIQANLWYNFTYDESKCYRDTLLILDAVAKDTWSTGNANTRGAGLAYYFQNVQDSSLSSIAGQELQTIAALNQAKSLTDTFLTASDGVGASARAFVGTRFDIVTTIINDPNDLPDPQDVTADGEITNNYKTVPTTVTFDAAVQVNATSNVFTIVGHGFTNGQQLVYNSNGNTPIRGLDNEQTYYVVLINTDEFRLSFDDSLTFPVDILETSTGNHQFLTNIREFFVDEIIENHTVYQTLILESGAESYEFVPGRVITGSTGSSNNSAYVYSWEPAERRLVVSIEQVLIGTSLLRVTFDVGSTITSDHSLTPNTDISVNEVSTRTGLTTATFTILSTTEGDALTNLTNLPEKQIWFHRPSIVNSSGHTWEYAGSGTDYNALPQNGGNTRVAFEQFEELPGRVYSSGTNELGDFKVGDFITAFNRTGNITFRNKVQVDELDALKLSVSDVSIEEISTDVNLGDNELGGSSNNRLSTQLAVRSFLSNRLGGFIDKTVSTAAVPGAIVQLNTNGQLNTDLIPATRAFKNSNSKGYLSRLEVVEDIPANDLSAGDIATEEYEQQELTLTGNITASDGDIITQPGVLGAIGYAKGDYLSASVVLVASQEAEWIAGDDSVGSAWQVGDPTKTIYVNGVDTGVYIDSANPSSAVTENFFLRSSNTSQYLVLDPNTTPVVTTASISTVARSSNVATIVTTTNHNLRAGNDVRIECSDTEFNGNVTVLSIPTATSFTYANTGTNVSATSETGSVRTIVTSTDSNAQGAVTEKRLGVLTNVDSTNLTGGSGYTPLASTVVYENVPLVSVTGVGVGARADITITAGAVSDVDIRRGGTGYEIGDLLSADPVDMAGDSAGTGFQIEVLGVEDRLYVNILGGELFVASESSIDLIEDNFAVNDTKVINFDDVISHNFLAGTLAGGGDVDYTLSRISIPNHGYTSGDPVTYNTLGNVAIGGLGNNQVYYIKVIDSNTVELYVNYNLTDQAEFLTTPANNNHNITRYTVNLVDNSFVVVNHGFSTGDAFRIQTLSDGSTANVLPEVSGTDIPDGARFFVGSVTTNSFTLHILRSDALASINGLVTNSRDITANGVGSAEIIQQNIKVNGVVNTSSRIKANWNSLAVTNIDASNIISGTISPSRLGASGTPNTDTFLRGDSSYSVVVQKLKKANTTDNPITLTGSSISGEFYGDPVSIGIANVDRDVGNLYSTLGTARFLQSQFDVATDASGQVFIKDGVVDAGTLDGLDSAYFLNPANLTSLVPVTKGGTGIGTYETGDLIFAASTGTLNTLNIGPNGTVLASSGTTPEWTNEFVLAGSATLSGIETNSTSIAKVFTENATVVEIGNTATTMKVGANTASVNLTTFVKGFEATITTDVVVNLNNITATTSANAGNGSTYITMSNTSNIQVGMLVTGTNIAANTLVDGKTATAIFLSNPTSGTVLSGSTLTFTYTPESLGIRAGDSVTIANSTITNLDGTWSVSGATFNANSFTIRTANNVTANPADPLAVGCSISRDNSIVIKHRNVILGSAEASSSPVGVTIKGEKGIGVNKTGGSITIEAGLGTGAATGGDFVVKTGQVTTTGSTRHTSTTRMTIDTSGKATFTGEIAANGGSVTTTQATASLFNTNATTVNIGGAATLVDIGASSGTTSINNNLDVDGDLNVDGGDITTNGTGTFNLINTNATTLNIGNAATTVSIGATSGTTTVRNNLTVTGDLEVQGNTVTLNTATLAVEDKNIEIAKVTSPTDTTADGAGITIKGATDKTITWNNNVGYFNVNQSWNLTSGLAYYINDAQVLSSTTLGSGVINSSLTSVGTINTGIWQGTIISPTYGGTGINNGSKTITLGGNLTTSGAHNTTFTTTGNTNVTLPTSGTLAVTGSGLNQFAATTSAELAGVISDETGSGALVFGTTPTFTTGIIAGSATMALFNTTATTINFGGAATSIVIGATTGTTRVRNALDVDGDVNIDGGDLTVSGATFNLANTTATTVNFAGAATDVQIGAATGTTNVNNNLTVDLDLAVNGGDLTTTASTFNLLGANATTVNAFGAATTINIGTTGTTTTITGDVSITGTASFGGIDVNAIDDIPIGSVTPSTGAFTTLTASGLTTFTNTTASTSTGTGAVVISGGLGVAGAVHANSFTGSIAASNINSGTFDNARIAESNVTQHQAAITGVGALNSGSITSGFGNINIGTSTFTGNGSGLTDLNASNLSTGTIQGARLGGNQTMAGVKTFSDTTESSASTNGAAIFQGGVGIAKALRVAGIIYGDGSGLTTLNASNLSSGTVADARLPTTMTAKTFSADIDVNGFKVGRGGGNSATNLAIAGGQAISTGTDNSVFGVGAMAGIVTGTDNTAMGNSALAALTSATHNTAVGNDSQAQRSSGGNYNTSVGAQSMSNSTAGSNNTAVGYQALELANGNQNVGIGSLAGDTLTSGSNNIIIGYNAQPSAVTVSNEITLGTATHNSLRIPGVNLSVSTTTFNFTGTSGYSGVGSNLTALNASQLTSGTVPDARIAQTSVTQHQGAITGTGALNSGSITSGFGSIDIGADNLTATGTVSLGATSFNDNNVTGIVDLTIDDQIISKDDTNTYLQFHAADQWRVVTGGAERFEVSNTGVIIANDLTVSGTTGITGVGTNITALNADNLSSGTIPSARVSGSYTGITGTGALDAGQITSNFGDINIGTSTFTGNGSGLTNVDAATVDGIDGASFLRSDAADTATALITLNVNASEQLRLQTQAAADSPTITFYQTTTASGYVRFQDANNAMQIGNDIGSTSFRIGTGSGGLVYEWVNGVTPTTSTVWHSGNHGTGSGLDADTVDGVQASSFVQTSGNQTIAGTKTFSSTISGSINGNAATVTNGVYTTGNQTIAGIKTFSDNAVFGGNVTPSVSGTQNIGTLANKWNGVFNQLTVDDLLIQDNKNLSFGTGADADIIFNATNLLMNLTAGDFLINDTSATSVTRFTFARTTGNFTATGEVTAYSDISLKDNIEVIADPLTKILSVRGVTFTRKDLEDTETRHMGVIAQEVEQYFPEVVHTTEDGIKTVNYGAMAGAFIEAFKEQQRQIDELRAMIQKLADK